ncbi:signal peptide containing protein [Theileria equi strain WA]|uniref:Signal peptide containing protein n=1 Tax=Theileria equi strain WA TaxID=1537102 RepID=L1LD35_THEEQ|nr:signal peptide containing protein [Theileria equi strain WA]EKX73337.1 signal peptide containing protein [Theileria equi strain WA]|eukprot:XP_004832789.1 signal peptide containing protein [Theileria equi strain WA]
MKAYVLLCLLITHVSCGSLGLDLYDNNENSKEVSVRRFGSITDGLIIEVYEGKRDVICEVFYRKKRFFCAPKDYFVLSRVVTVEIRDYITLVIVKTIKRYSREAKYYQIKGVDVIAMESEEDYLEVASHKAISDSRRNTRPILAAAKEDNHLDSSGSINSSTSGESFPDNEVLLEDKNEKTKTKGRRNKPKNGIPSSSNFADSMRQRGSGSTLSSIKEGDDGVTNTHELQSKDSRTKAFMPDGNLHAKSFGLEHSSSDGVLSSQLYTQNDSSDSESIEGSRKPLLEGLGIANSPRTPRTTISAKINKISDGIKTRIESMKVTGTGEHSKRKWYGSTCEQSAESIKSVDGSERLCDTPECKSSESTGSLRGNVIINPIFNDGVPTSKPGEKNLIDWVPDLFHGVVRSNTFSGGNNTRPDLSKISAVSSSKSEPKLGENHLKIGSYSRVSTDDNFGDIDTSLPSEQDFGLANQEEIEVI